MFERHTCPQTIQDKIWEALNAVKKWNVTFNEGLRVAGKNINTQGWDQQDVEVAHMPLYHTKIIWEALNNS